MIFKIPSNPNRSMIWKNWLVTQQYLLDGNMTEHTVQEHKEPFLPIKLQKIVINSS